MIGHDFQHMHYFLCKKYSIASNTPPAMARDLSEMVKQCSRERTRIDITNLHTRGHM